MIVRKFMQWAATASAVERAEGAGSLARAWLYADLSETDRAEAEVALTTLLDDPAPCVRKALSESFASAPEAPPAIVVAPANDQSDVAAPVLGRSPVLGDGELTKKLTISAHRFSKSALEKIEKAGGEAVVLPGPAPVVKPEKPKKAKASK